MGAGRGPTSLAVLNWTTQHDGGYSMTLGRTPDADTWLFATLTTDADVTGGFPSLAGFTFWQVTYSRNSTNNPGVRMWIGRADPYYAGAYSTAFSIAGSTDPANDFPNLIVGQCAIGGMFTGRPYALGAETNPGSGSSITVTAPAQTRERGGIAFAACHQDSGGAGPNASPAAPWEHSGSAGLGSAALYLFPSGLNAHKPAPSVCTWSNSVRNDTWSGCMVFLE